MNKTDEFNSIVQDILENKEFNKTRYIEHHGVTRFDHLYRVAYYSYKVSKKLHFKYEEVARGAFLHDFFFSDELRSRKEKFLSTFIHPKWAVKNSKKYFELTELEENIIESHMFPINPKLPKHKESLLVSIVDKVVATYEFSLKFKVKFKYATNVLVLVLYGVVK